MMRTATEFCLACGLPAPSQSGSCAECSTPFGIAQADTIGHGSVRALMIDATSGQELALAVSRTDSTYTIVAANAGVSHGHNDLGPTARDVGGVQGVGSLIAAVLIARHQLFNLSMSIEPWRNLVVEMSAGRIDMIRRAALSLCDAGIAELMPCLPLTASECAWWTARTKYRLGQWSDAIEHLRTLPRDRYPVALPLLYTATRNLDASNAAREGSFTDAVNDRVAGRSSTDVARDAAHWSAGVSTQPWLIDRALHPSSPREKSAAALLALARGAEPADRARVAIPADCPAELVDDLIDRGLQLVVDDAVTGSAERAYVDARVRPGAVDEAELERLDFKAEIARRQLHRGATVVSDLPSDAPPDLVSAVRFAREGMVDDALMQRMAQGGESLRLFLGDPSEAALHDDFCVDTSLWPYLLTRLPPGAIDWEAPVGSERRRFLAWSMLRTAVTALYDADWEGATSGARRVLYLSGDESLRDEALNVIACACWQQGNDEAARRALESALEGSRNPALQVNLGVIAGELAPEVAALELARLVREASTLELRSAAALRAARLWLTDDLTWDTEADEGMPAPVRDALRLIVVEPIELDTFRTIVAMLANLDSDWLEDTANLAASPHRHSMEAAVYSARAAGPNELVDALVKAMAVEEPPAWLLEERDKLVKIATDAAIDDPSSSAAIFVLNAMEKGLPVSVEQRILIAPLAVLAVCAIIDPDEGEPADKFEVALAAAEADAKAAGRFDRLEEIYDDAWDRLVSAKVIYAAKQLKAVMEACDRMTDQLVGIPRHRLDMAAVRRAFGAAAELTRELETSVKKLPKHRVQQDTQEFIDAVLRQLRVVKDHISEITR